MASRTMESSRAGPAVVATGPHRAEPAPAREPRPAVVSEDRLWCVVDVAYYLSVPVQTVYSWRGQGVGPPGRLVGRRLRYRPEDVKRWVAALPTEVAL